MLEQAINAAYYQSKRDAFEAAGFRKSYDACRGKPGTLALYQKRIKNAEGTTLYFIDVWEYSFSGMKMPEIAKARYQFGIEVTLYRDDGISMSLNLHWEPESMTPESIQSFYAEAHQRLGCGADRYNN